MENKKNCLTVDILLSRYEELIRKEAQIEFIKNWVSAQSGYTNIEDLKTLLDVCDKQNKKR